VAMYSGKDLARGIPTRLYGDFLAFPGSFVPISPTIGDMNGDGYGELAISIDRGGPAHVKVWSGLGLASGSLAPAASFYAFPPTDPSGARVAIRDTNGDGLSELFVASGNARNSLARVFSYSEAVAGGVASAPIYPLGTPYTYDGIYAGQHTDTTIQSQATASDDHASLPGAETEPGYFTASVPPVLHHCTCAACRVLTDLANAASQEPLVSGIPVA
jgi:hypothetical protein